VRLVPDIPCGKKEPRLFYRGFKCVSLEKVFYPKAQITQMAVQKMQVIVQKNTSQTINQLVILRTVDERNRTAGSSSHRPLGFGSRAAFVCHNGRW
jgi:hypothetical protein